MIVLYMLFTFGLQGILISGSKEYNGKESWGYVNVRKDAYMFWWLYYVDVGQNYKDYPLIIWLQGGPGASSTGYGNFKEIGPLDVHLKPRNTTWVAKANLLFIDNPVGTGFSYVSNSGALAKNNTQIADDLVAMMIAFYSKLPEFQKMPLYIFSESYGGKMTASFSLALYKAIKAGKMACNFQGLALGDSWISPIDSVATWGQYLYTMSLIDKNHLLALDERVNAIRKALATSQFSNATNLFQLTQDDIGKYTNGVNWYNILLNEGPVNESVIKLPKDHKLYNLYKRQVAFFHGDQLSDLMNGEIRKKLHIIPKNVTWGGQSAQVFDALTEDFMRPVVDTVDALLNETTLSINIYTGQLDLIVDTLGTLQWIQQLKWPGLKQFLSAPRNAILLPQNRTAGFVKSFKNLNFFWILEAGHMVPADAGISALKMLEMILPKA